MGLEKFSRGDSGAGKVAVHFLQCASCELKLDKPPSGHRTDEHLPSGFQEAGHLKLGCDVSARRVRHGDLSFHWGCGRDAGAGRTENWPWFLYVISLTQGVVLLTSAKLNRFAPRTTFSKETAQRPFPLEVLIELWRKDLLARKLVFFY